MELTSKEYWTKDKCATEALKYKSKSEFFKNNSNVYGVSCQGGWINEICSHMVIIKENKKIRRR